MVLLEDHIITKDKKRSKNIISFRFPFSKLLGTNRRVIMLIRTVTLEKNYNE